MSRASRARHLVVGGRNLSRIRFHQRVSRHGQCHGHVHRHQGVQAENGCHLVGDPQSRRRLPFRRSRADRHELCGQYPGFLWCTAARTPAGRRTGAPADRARRSGGRDHLESHHLAAGVAVQLLTRTLRGIDRRHLGGAWCQRRQLARRRNQTGWGHRPGRASGPDVPAHRHRRRHRGHLAGALHHPARTGATATRDSAGGRSARRPWWPWRTEPTMPRRRWASSPWR